MEPEARMVRQMDAFVPPTVLDRPLLPDEDAALRWILWLEDIPGADELRAQVGHVRATWGRTTEMHLEVTDAEPAPVEDGVLSQMALVVGAGERPVGLISVWVEGGYLSGLEYSWFTDRMPTEYPSSDRLRLHDPSPRSRGVAGSKFSSTEAAMDEIESIILRRRADIVEMVGRLRAGPIDQQTADELQLVLIDELLEHGMFEDWEPNERGLEVELLIDVVQGRVDSASDDDRAEESDVIRL